MPIFKSIIQNLREYNRNRREQKENDSLTQSIISSAAQQRHPELGIPIDKPLIDEHPGLNLALMYAQPGSIFTKVLAPYAYKGMTQGFANGEGAQAIIYGLIPESGEWVEISKRAAELQQGNPKKYAAYKAVGKNEHLPGKIASRKSNLVERGITTEGEPYVIRKNQTADPNFYKNKQEAYGKLWENLDGGPAEGANSGSGTLKVRGHEEGGILKSQHGNKILDKGQQLYDSKFGKVVRDFMLGKDRDLSDEEYFNKYGYSKPIASSGMLGFLVAPEGAGLEFPEITAYHYGSMGKPIGQAIETERLTNIPQQISKVKSVVKVKDPYSPTMKAAFKERTGYEFDGIPEVMKQRELKSGQDYIVRLRQGHKRQ